MNGMDQPVPGLVLGDDFSPMEVAPGREVGSKPLRARVFHSKYKTTRKGHTKVWFTDGSVYPGPSGNPTAFIWSHPRGDLGNASYQGYIPWDFVRCIDPHPDTGGTQPDLSGRSQSGMDVQRGLDVGGDGEDDPCPVCGRTTCKHRKK